MNKEDFKVVKDEVKAATAKSIREEIEEFTTRGTELQKYLMSEEGKKEPFALRRLKMEQFNIYASIIECLTAQESIIKKE